MTAPLSASSNCSFFIDNVMPLELKTWIIDFAIFSSQNPPQQSMDLALVSIEWHQISLREDTVLRMLAEGCKVKEVILKRLIFIPSSELILVKAWTCLFQEKFDLANAPTTKESIWTEWDYEDTWESGTELRIQKRNEFQKWLSSLDLSYRALIRTADFSKKKLIHEDQFAILEKLPELISLTFNETGFYEQKHRILDDKIGPLVSLCPKLEGIFLVETLLSEKGIDALFSACPLLKTLHVSGCYFPWPTFFEILSPRIVRLELNQSLEIASEGFEEVLKRAAKQCPRLEYFKYNDRTVCLGELTPK